MNETLQQFARQNIKEGLARLPESNQTLFKRMYAPWVKNPENLSKIRISVQECDAMPINDVVEQMPADKLDWAMQQVENSLRKIYETKTQPTL